MEREESRRLRVLSPAAEFVEFFRHSVRVLWVIQRGVQQGPANRGSLALDVRCLGTARWAGVSRHSHEQAVPSKASAMLQERMVEATGWPAEVWGCPLPPSKSSFGACSWVPGRSPA